MEINVGSLKIELSKLNKLLEEYNSNNLNLYNELSGISSYWVDNHSTLFSNTVHFEKLEIKKTYTEIKELKDIYSYMIIAYQELGNKIKINMSGREIVLTKFNNLINRLTKIINLYDNLDYNFANITIIGLLNSEKKTLIETKEKIIDLKANIYNKFNDIENIEREITLKVSRMNIDFIEEIKIEGMV